MSVSEGPHPCLTLRLLTLALHAIALAGHGSSATEAHAGYGETAAAPMSPSPQPSSTSGSLSYSPSMRRGVCCRALPMQRLARTRTCRVTAFLCASELARAHRNAFPDSTSERQGLSSHRLHEPSPSHGEWRQGVCGRELARKYGSVSLSPHVPDAGPQPALWQGQSAEAPPSPGAHASASSAPADAEQPLVFAAELQVSSAEQLASVCCLPENPHACQLVTLTKQRNQT